MKKGFFKEISSWSDFNWFGKVGMILFMIPFTILTILLLVVYSPLLLCVNVWGVRKEKKYFNIFGKN